jgi:hypothetical protein
MDKVNRLYSPQEIIEMGVFPFRHQRTIARYIAKGEIKGVVKGNGNGRRYYVRGGELQKYYNKLIKKDGQKANRIK